MSVDLMKQYGKVVKVVETTTREFFFDGSLTPSALSPRGKGTAAPTVAATSPKGKGVTLGGTKPKASKKNKATVTATPASSPENAGQKEGFKRYGKPAWKWAAWVCYSITSMKEAGKTMDEIIAFVNEALASAEAKYGEAYAKVMAAKIESNPKWLALTVEAEA